MASSAAILLGSRSPRIVFGKGKNPEYTSHLEPVSPGTIPGGSTVTFWQETGLPIATQSHVGDGSQSIRVTRPSAMLTVDAVLGKGVGFQQSVMKDRWELTILQTVDANDERRYYGETNEGRDFYLTSEVIAGRSYPLLDTITSPDEAPPKKNPSYSNVSVASFDPNDIGEASGKVINEGGVVKGSIYAKFEPSVNARCVIPFSENPDAFREHGLTASRFYLTEIQKSATVRTWLSTRNATGGKVYPLIMFERYFKFNLKVKIDDDTGKDAGYRFVDSPTNSELPKIYLDGDGRFPPIPSFPDSALQLDAHNNFVIAKNGFTWKPVFL
jgi:hypothetical protein